MGVLTFLLLYQNLLTYSEILMDKRTLLFVLAFAVTLFFVNLYFQHQNEESTREWNEQRKAKQVKKAEHLESEIQQRTAKASDLPLMQIYADSDAKDFLTSGLSDENNVVTLAWSDNLPLTVYIKKFGSSGKPEEYTLAHRASRNEPIIFQQGSPQPLHVAKLPEFGKFDLQLIAPLPQNQAKPFEIVLGEYTDGHFIIPAQELQKLKSEIESTKPPLRKEYKTAIAVMKTTKGYAPVAIYQKENSTLIYLDEIPGLSTDTPKISTTPAISKTTEEKFYVLETPYQQLVFSNFGGALSEINLPFASKNDPLSVVRPIEFDREIVEKHPYNAYFPAHPYFTPGKTTPVEHAQGTLGGYYPLIRRDLIQSGNRKSIRVSPQYYALNIISDYPEVAELVYEVKEFTDNSIVFEVNQGHRRITKTYTLEANEKQAPYCLNLSIQIEGDSRGLWLTTGIPEVEWISGGPAPALKYRITRNQKADVENVDLPKDAISFSNIYPDWTCDSNGFFGIILDPLSEIEAGFKAVQVSGTVVPSRLIEVEQEYDKFKPENLPGYEMLLPLKKNAGIMNFRIFAGPFSSDVLETIDKTYSDSTTGYNPDYIACQSFHGWFAFISEPFAKFLFILMRFFYQLTGSWAFSIILLTIALRLMLFPLNAWSTKSMLKMQQIAPEVTAIQAKYKKDPKKVQLEIMNLYRDRGVNPLSGCFPLLIQMPFLIGMFDLLKSTFELRGATFIPGWIDNLTAPDVLFSWQTPIFFIGNQFHLLPILLGVVMFFQQRMQSPLPKDPTLLTDQQRQQKAMGTIMPIIFAVMFYNFPSGLNIYWLSSMLLGLLQQWLTARHFQSKSVQTVPEKK